MQRRRHPEQLYSGPRAPGRFELGHLASSEWARTSTVSRTSRRSSLRSVQSGDVSSAVSKHFLQPAPRRVRAPSVQSVLLEQLEFALRRRSKWGTCLLKVSFNMQSLLKKFLSNNKLGGISQLRDRHDRA